MSKGETKYQADLIGKIERLLPGCSVFKNNPEELQGVPDLLILFENHWAMLEVKLAHDSDVRPNQQYYVDHFNSMSFCAFIFPENEKEVLDALQSAFGVSRQTRLFKSK
jgi:hypothetical protein